MKNLIKGFWVDDHIDEITGINDRLAADSIKLDIFDSDTELFDAIGSGKCEYSIGILDLRLENSTETGISVTNRLKGLFSDRKKPLYLPFGTVTGHIDQFAKELSEEKNNPFVFKFEKPEISNGKFNDFKYSIEKYSSIFSINQKALYYNEQHPVENINPQELKLESVFFGYIEEADNDNFYIKFWNPKDIKSEFTRKYSIDSLRKYGINENIQHVRLSLFEMVKVKNSPLVSIIEPIGGIDTSRTCKIDDNFDFNKFIKWKN